MSFRLSRTALVVLLAFLKPLNCRMYPAFSGLVNQKALPTVTVNSLGGHGRKVHFSERELQPAYRHFLLGLEARDCQERVLSLKDYPMHRLLEFQRPLRRLTFCRSRLDPRCRHVSQHPWNVAGR